MPVQSHGGGWRARKKHAGQWFIGPLRQSAQVAEDDSRRLDDASAVSVEALRERCRNLATTDTQTRLSWWSDIALAGVSGVGQKSTGAVVPLEEIKPWLKKMPVVWRMPCGCHRRKLTSLPTADRQDCHGGAT